MQLGKTQAMFFSCSRSVPTEKLHFCGADLPFVQSHKHLGFILSSNLTANAHVDFIRKIASQIFLLRQLRIKTTDQDILCGIYRSYIRPHFEYASPAWSALPGYLSEKLESLQRRAIRIILGHPYRQQVELHHYQSLGLSLLQSLRNPLLFQNR